LHDMLAKALFEQDDRRNIDRVIREQEMAWAIASPLPPNLSSDLPPAHLGIYYGMKGNFLGSPANDQSRPWYEKSIAVLLRAREISRVSEKAFDEAQLAHGKPLSRRPAFPLLYFQLAYDYLNLGHYPEALEALQYGRNLEPRSPDFYDLMAIAYGAMGKPDRAVIALEEKAQIDGFKPAAIAAIRDLYRKIPDGACAVREQNGALAIDVECPRLRSDMCLASVELTQAFVEARNPAQASEIKNAARARYGCPAV